MVPTPNSATSDTSESREIVLAETVAGVTAFLPLPPEKNAPGIDYVQYVTKRIVILEVVRRTDQAAPKLVKELADALIELDPELPTGWFGAIRSTIKFGKVYRERQRRRELYQKVTRSLLEKLFDPLL